MPTTAQRSAVKRHRDRTTARGLRRVEVQVPHESADLIRSVAGLLRDHPDCADALSRMLRARGPDGDTWGAFMEGVPDVGAPELDAAFDPPRRSHALREVDL